MHPKVISLFAGCGGSSLGYKMAGCDVIASVERDPAATAIYKANFPDVDLWEQDISILNPLDLLNKHGLKPGELTILDGSPPCQGFSMLGKRKVLDPRNQLFTEYVRFLRVMKPKAFCMENVPGLVAGDMRYLFQKMMDALKNEGYAIQARILNASHYGVPQERRRVIVLGIREDLGLLPEHPRPISLPVTFRQAVQGLTKHELIEVPIRQALKLGKALRPGESGKPCTSDTARRVTIFR